MGCGDSRRRVLIANSDGLLAQDDQIRTRFNVVCVANGDTGMQTGYESLARTEGFEIFERHPVEDIAHKAADRALAKLSARPAPSGEVPIVLAGGSGRHPLPRGVRARARGRPHRQGRLGLHRPGRAAGRQPAGHAGRRRHGARGVGQLRGRRRRVPAGPQRADRERGPDRLHVGLAAGAQGGSQVLGQRPPPELPAPADGAHDEHVPAGRRGGPRRDRGADADRASTSRSSAAARSTPPRATSSSAPRRRT